MALAMVATWRRDGNDCHRTQENIESGIEDEKWLFFRKQKTEQQKNNIQIKNECSTIADGQTVEESRHRRRTDTMYITIGPTATQS